MGEGFLLTMRACVRMSTEWNLTFPGAALLASGKADVHQKSHYLRRKRAGIEPSTVNVII